MSQFQNSVSFGTASNDKNIAEIGMGTYSFLGAKYIANIGCIVSMKEAKEISRKVTCIPVKDTAKRKGLEGFSHAAGGAGAPESPVAASRRCAQKSQF
ncbi:MAG: hypothetical protein LBB77_00260 [Treponema sp.]|jgi:hypothetical protein|nr:hypothetical protein [Treponema sp.]